jgi:TRAP transporter TAXI family solute receptor
MKKLLTYFGIGLCLLILMGTVNPVPEAQAKTQYFVWTTGGVGGTWYPLGSGIASYITKNVEGISIAAQASGGAMENLNLINSNQADFGFLPSAPAYTAYRGMKPFDKPHKNMVGIGMLHQNSVYAFALKKSGIKSYYDLRGKKVQTGAAGAGATLICSMVLAGHNMTLDDIVPTHLPIRESSDALKDGRISAIFTTSAIPGAAVLDVASVRDITIIDYAPGAMDKILAKEPYFMKTTIPAGTYRGVDREVPILGEGTLVTCSPSLPEDVVYTVTKTIYSKACLDYLKKIHSAAKTIRPEGGLNGMTMKLHPGAAKYWKEVGLYDAWDAQKPYN